MTIKALEQRLAAVEAELAELKRKVAEPKPQRDWRKTIGMFTDNEGMKEMFQDALKLREADRAKARRSRKPRKAKG
jgi:hypothetical protein